MTEKIRPAHATSSDFLALEAFDVVARRNGGRINMLWDIDNRRFAGMAAIEEVTGLPLSRKHGIAVLAFVELDRILEAEIRGQMLAEGNEDEFTDDALGELDRITGRGPRR